MLHQFERFSSYLMLCYIMCLYMCVFMYVCIYIHTHIYIQIMVNIFPPEIIFRISYKVIWWPLFMTGSHGDTYFT